MQRDTSAQHESDSARVTEDTGDTSLNQDTSSVETAGASVTSDTATTDTASAAGYAAMARDTSGGVDQIDTTATAAVGSEVGDTTMNAGRVRPIEDSTETMVQVTTDTVNLATVAGDAAIGGPGRGHDRKLGTYTSARRLYGDAGERELGRIGECERS